MGIFPGHDAIIRLVGAVLAEQNDVMDRAPPIHEIGNTRRLMQAAEMKQKLQLVQG